MSDTTRAPTETWYDEVQPLPPRLPRFDHHRPPPSIAGRYLVHERLGTGATGSVWRCIDRIEREEVAVKVVGVLTPAELNRVRRETVALRWARLPGVVRLRDELRIGADWYLVMDRVQGRPFPGVQLPATWAAIEPLVRSLLEILGTLHDAGVVHGDLKPSNVFALADRPEVVLLDLGLASGSALARARPGVRFAGTPLYAAPELLWGQSDPRVDLYAVGVMLYQAVTGSVPLVHDNDLAMVALRGRKPSPSVALLAPELDPPVVHLIDELLAMRPEDRPQTAWEALDRLGGRTQTPLSWLGHLPEGRVEPSALVPLFHGPDAYLHLREDAARVLHDRTGGDRSAIAEELSAWMRAGLCRWEEGALRVERTAIARLEVQEGLADEVRPAGPDDDLVRLIALAYPYATGSALAQALGRDVSSPIERLIAQGRVWPVPTGLGARPAKVLGPAEAMGLLPIATALPAGSAGRLELLLRGGAPLDELVEALVSVLRDRSVAPERGLALLQPLLARARADQHAPHVLELTAWWACLALMLEASGPVERALFEVQRAQVELVDDPVAQDLNAIEQLLLVALAHFRGVLAERASQVSSLPTFRWDELDVWRCGMSVEIARLQGGDHWDRAIEGLRPWAQGSADRAARLDGWQANGLYRQGRYREAALLHERASQGKSGLNGRLLSLRAAASAWMEAGEYARSEQLARQVRTSAAAARLPLVEAIAEWSERSARTRQGETLEVALDLVEAAFAVDTTWGALMAVAEATNAWRGGLAQRATDLAQRALPVFERSKLRNGVVISRLILLLSATESPDPGEVETLLTSARRDAGPRILLQVLGLLGQRLGRPDLVGDARGLAATAFAPGQGTAMEMGSLADVLGCDSTREGVNR